MTAGQTDTEGSGGCDLHTHSVHSDGSMAPEEILSRAESSGLSAVALTDHDTVSGLDEFLSASKQYDIKAVPGVELSCHSESGRFHILGYYIDPERPGLVKKLQYYQEERAERVRGMVKKLRQLSDIDFTFEEIEQKAGQSLLAKPHVAQVMVERGFVDGMDEAFEQYLASGQPLDKVPKDRMSVSEALQTIKNAGGVSVLAHPGHYEDVDIRRFKQIGVDGLEVFYSDHTDAQTDHYLEIARDLDLVVTGGSDFHGDIKPSVNLGDLTMSEQYHDALQQACRQSGARRDLLAP